MSTIQRSIRLTGKDAAALDRSSGNNGEIFYDTTKQTLRIYNRNGNSILATETYITSIVSDLATESYVDTAISNIDLSGLATESYVDTAISNIPSVDLSGLATESYVTTAISNISIPSISGLATETYVTTAISNLVDTAPTTLDTLNELAAALNDDASFSTTVTTALGNKAPSADPTFTGTMTLQQSTELLNTKTGATGTVTHDFSTGAIWVHTSISANFTANFTNVPTTDNRAISIVLILVQGGTARIPSGVQIDGSAQTILWQDNTTPTGNANKRDLVSFTLVRSGATWTVLGSLSTYG